VPPWPPTATRRPPSSTRSWSPHDRLVHQDRLGLELVVAPGADLAGLGEAQAAPEAEHLVVGADHAEAQAPGPRPAGKQVALQGLEGGRPDALALAGAVDEQQAEVDGLVVWVAEQQVEQADQLVTGPDAEGRLVVGELPSGTNMRVLWASAGPGGCPVTRRANSSSLSMIR
jgi:hypothetical protein